MIVLIIYIVKAKALISCCAVVCYDEIFPKLMQPVYNCWPCAPFQNDDDSSCLHESFPSRQI